MSLFTCYFQDYKKIISSNRLLSDGFLENDYVYTCIHLAYSKMAENTLLFCLIVNWPLLPLSNLQNSKEYLA